MHADQTFYLIRSKHDTSPSANPITTGAWQGSHWSTNFSHWYDLTWGKIYGASGNRTQVYALETDASTTRPARRKFCLLVGCLTSQQHASVSQGRICSDNFTCCHTEIEVEDPTFHLTQSQYTDTGPTRPSADPIIPGTWQGSHWSANF